ncbi:MAG: 4'-phosphopantetheinyl transferase superfamily protein [Deltaproteobacteria bacterium]|nr:4'-phosphopantetheinyl transferase superfamily protein [Deltaproteobacteria bacterium]
MIASPFSEHVSFVCLGSVPEGLDIYREEALILSPKAVSKRRTEFKTGRVAAHRAVQRLTGQPSPPILKGQRGEPLWPDHLVGSIAHTDGIAMAAVAFQAVLKGIGVDFELKDRRFSTAISDRVCTDAEKLWVNEDAQESAQRFLTVFSAKESFYKAYTTCYRAEPAFTDVLLCVVEGQRFTIKTLNEHTVPSRTLEGLFVGYKWLDGYVVTFMEIPADDAGS